jgi:hypothetical protein
VEVVARGSAPTASGGGSGEARVGFGVGSLAGLGSRVVARGELGGLVAGGLAWSWSARGSAALGGCPVSCD